VPVKWRVLDSDGNAVDDRDQVSIPTSAPGDCEAGAAPDAIETYTAEPGGLQYLGDGYWQYNWKTSKQ
jgi:hypothetical protein